MRILILIGAIGLTLSAGSLHAGVITKGDWHPSGCGEKPATPQIDASNVDTFNKSVATINDWQRQAKTYFECLVKEANNDNAIIAESANREQAAYRQAFEEIAAEADAAKAKLDKK